MASLYYLWPIGLVVLSNVVYQICAKAVPGGMSPFVSLFIMTGNLSWYHESGELVP